MRVYVVVDMEGISGIVSIQQVDITEPASAEGRELLALIAFSAGALRVPVVFDSGDRAAIEEVRELLL